MDHIKEDILYSLIDGSIEGSERETHESHISECDACFSMYATLKSSFTEIESTDLKTTPADLIKRAEIELGFGKKTTKPPRKPKPWDALIEIIQNKLNDLLVPVLAPVTALLLIVFGLFRVYSPAVVRVADSGAAVTAPALRGIPKDAKAPVWKSFNPDIKYQAASNKNNGSKNFNGPLRVPDLSNKSIKEIELILQTQGARYIIYKSNIFSQIPAPGTEYNSKDTLKIYFPSSR